MTDIFFTKQAASYFLSIFLSLTCLLIYLIYRPEEIIINHYFFTTYPSLSETKNSIKDSLPLSNFLIYNLPAGLWIMALTISAGDFKLNLLSRKIQLAYLPIILGLTIEFSQLIRLTDGTFDPIDIVIMLIFNFLSFKIKTSLDLDTKQSKTQPLIIFIGFTILFFGNN